MALFKAKVGPKQTPPSRGAVPAQPRNPLGLRRGDAGREARQHAGVGAGGGPGHSRHGARLRSGRALAQRAAARGAPGAAAVSGCAGRRVAAPARSQVQQEGPKWSRIVQQLPGRTVSSVRNRWCAPHAHRTRHSPALPGLGGCASTACACLSEAPVPLIGVAALVHRQRIEKGRKLREAGVESKNRCVPHPPSRARPPVGGPPHPFPPALHPAQPPPPPPRRCHACGEPKRGHICYQKLRGGPQARAAHRPHI
eukprot:scaffold5601_cov104-Isochrysis_galbana.AAC.2